MLSELSTGELDSLVLLGGGQVQISNYSEDLLYSTMNVEGNEPKEVNPLYDVCSMWEIRKRGWVKRGELGPIYPGRQFLPNVKGA